MIAHEYIHPKETYANIFSYPRHMTMVREARRIMRFRATSMITEFSEPRGKINRVVRTVENCAPANRR